MPDFDYVRAEIATALSGHPEDDEPLRIKIRGDRGETKWLRATPDQVRSIADILGAPASEPPSW